MATRIDRIQVTFTLYVEFEGSHTTCFAYVPQDQNDPLVLAVRAKNEELLLMAAVGKPEAEVV